MHGYRGMVGVKTGYTTLAGRTYVGAAERGGHLLVVTLMKVTGPTEQAAQQLLDWGFANVGKQGVGELVQPLSLASPSPTPTPSAATHRVTAGLGGGGGSGPGRGFPLWLADRHRRCPRRRHRGGHPAQPAGEPQGRRPALRRRPPLTTPAVHGPTSAHAPTNRIHFDAYEIQMSTPTVAAKVP